MNLGSSVVKSFLVFLWINIHKFLFSSFYLLLSLSFSCEWHNLIQINSALMAVKILKYGPYFTSKSGFSYLLFFLLRLIKDRLYKWEHLKHFHPEFFFLLSRFFVYKKAEVACLNSFRVLFAIYCFLFLQFYRTSYKLFVSLMELNF